MVPPDMMGLEEVANSAEPIDLRCLLNWVPTPHTQFQQATALLGRLVKHLEIAFFSVRVVGGKRWASNL